MLETRRETLVYKRDGRSVPFEAERIEDAVAAAFRAEHGLGATEPLPTRLHADAKRIAATIAEGARALPGVPGGIPVERIQDAVEEQLMRHGHYDVARRYIIYREEHRKARLLRGEQDSEAATEPSLQVTYPGGARRPLEPGRIRARVLAACDGLLGCDPREILDEVFASLYDGIAPEQIARALVLAARSRIEREPAYGTAAARLLLRSLYSEAWGAAPSAGVLSEVYRERFPAYLREAVRAGRLDPQLLELDLGRLSAALEPERDGAFTYLGLQTVYDRYLIDIEGRRVELPQYFWMRVAMGIALREEEPEARAIEFYETLSSFRFVSATPTLFNSGTLHPQLSSCYLTTVGDDLSAIFKAIGDNAMLSKWAGGLGNDWTPVRATGSYIQGTHGHGQGVIPFLKIVSDTAVAVNQGGKRKGAVCSYLETWHLDIEDFLELRKNTGDERRRTHDMHTANWIPDLFMKRVRDGAHWTLFSPNETPELHDLYGRAFEERYEEYERLALEGHLRQHKRVDALGLWRKMLSMLFETGHPWMTWKDPSNLRSPQDHAGVVHNSNLCTEILLNTSAEETAVCNLGSVNLAAHTGVQGLHGEMLATTVRTAVRMLDNVIDINYYPTPEAHTANLRHRPVGLGVMGFQDALHKLRLSYASAEAVKFADRSMELVSYRAILASAELSGERGRYPSYDGSKWSRGLFPMDTLELVQTERGGELDVDRTMSLDWTPVREAVARTGMRNSNVLAIAPTATISNISGVSQSIEPNYRNLFAKSNLSGDFTVINSYLVADLKGLGLWDADMLDALKYYDGSVQEIEAIPEELKLLYRTAAEIEPEWLIEAASRRQKWIDMGQSLNLYISQPDGRKLHEMYFLAWRKGLKTTYYLRSMGATQVEKSSADVNRRGLQPRWMKNRSASSRIKVAREESPKACSITDPGCEACQ